MHLPTPSPLRSPRSADIGARHDVARRAACLCAFALVGLSALSACTPEDPRRSPLSPPELVDRRSAADTGASPSLYGTGASQDSRGLTRGAPASVGDTLVTSSALIALNEAHMGLSPVKIAQGGRVSQAWRAQRRDELALAWQTLLKEAGVPESAALRRYATLPVMLIDADWAPALAGHPGVASIHDNSPVTLNASSSLQAMGDFGRWTGLQQ